ncbi:MULTISPECIES: glycosyltransferase [unclassified Lentimicrobium]|uniref:glycosyltransferase n=1 Tax=unclassified Lentimicrobium TaxID=2677434 RepID=UPI001555600F|nr:MULTISPECIES: glycosyltransferase [unclassified Lentimicrobium]NPD46597.1 glycosyltransferase [Lentimicrobium sp. S6]NPD83816.1 glycosyltransferase [Lentimicrobium sp. L6]
MIGRDIIVIGIQPWDIEIGSNCKNIAEEMSKYNRVLYVNSPLDRNTKKNKASDERTQKRIRICEGKEDNLVQLSTNMWNLYPHRMIESINWLPDGKLYDFINKRNNRKFAADIQEAIDHLGFKDFIIFNDSNMFTGLHQKELLKPKTYVYYMRDYLTKNPYWRKHGLRIEPKLVEKADVVVNNSTLYAEYGRQFNKHSYMVGQGCDVSLFRDADGSIPIPEDMKEFKSPVIGYVGFLSSRRLDIDLLVFMAKKRPKWSIVLVGPEDEKFEASELHKLENVHFLGSRDSSQLPSYIKAFDIAMNPQLINDATIGNYPRKIDEYLAMGKPTIGSATKAMDYFKDHTYLASTHEEWVAVIDKALNEDSKELQKERISCGTSHSWENNVKEIFKYVTAFENGWKDL